VAAPIFVTGDVPTASQVNSWFVNTTWARKPNNTDRASTTTFTDDPDLFVNVAANAVYEIRCSLLIHSSNIAAGDFKMKFTAPTGAVMLATLFGYDAAATTNNGIVGAGLTLNTSGSLGAVSIAEPWNPAQVSGTLVTSASAGLFTLQWAQNTSSATVTRLQQHSFISLTRKE
jgi:hypothetical protein